MSNGRPFQHRSLILALFGLLSIGVILSLPGLTTNLDRSWWDFLSVRTADPAHLPDPDAVLLLIDENTVREVSEQHGERWPWRRSTFAGLLAAINQAGAERIIVDLLFIDPSEDGAEDAVLAAYAASIPGLVLAELPNQPSILRGELPDGFGFQTGLVDYQPDSDGVIRQYRFKNSLIASAIGTYPPEEFRVHWYGRATEFPQGTVLSAAPFVKQGYRILEEVKSGGADDTDPPTVQKALTFLNLPPFTKKLSGKTVILGVNHAAGFDVKAFPVSKVECGALIHYTAWQNAVGHDWLREPWPRAAGWPTLLLGWLLGTFVIIVGWRERTSVHVIRGITLGLIFFSVIVSAFAFTGNLVLPIAWPVAAIVLAYLAAASRHWWLQQKQRREVEGYFGSYVAPAVLEELRAGSGPRLGGERREITLFFSDMAGFTTLSESVPPETLVDIVNRCLSVQTEPIITEGGYLDKYIGDAVMGVFGAPLPLTNHALSACRAALACRDALAVLTTELKKEFGVDIAVRIGLNTGTAVVGNVGSERKLNYTALGDPVNLASRLEGANKAYGTLILVGESTITAAGPSIISRPVDLLQVKGKTHAVPVHELLGLANKMSSAELDRAKRHAEAFAHYRGCRFPEALTIFEALAVENPDDPLSPLMANRCRSYITQPPPADWDGVTALKDK